LPAILPDESKVLSHPLSLNLECQFSTVTFENEGKPNGHRHHSGDKTIDLQTMKEANRLLSRGLNSCNWSVPNLEDRDENVQTLEDLEIMAENAVNASDAAFFEDLVLEGPPVLAGACCGFGFNFTDAFPASTNDKSKP